MFNSMSPLPDWAIISIALTLALSVIAGGSLKKRELREQLLKILRLFLQSDRNRIPETETNSNNSNESNNSNNSNNSKNSNNTNRNKTKVNKVTKVIETEV